MDQLRRLPLIVLDLPVLLLELFDQILYLILDLSHLLLPFKDQAVLVLNLFKVLGFFALNSLIL